MAKWDWKIQYKSKSEPFNSFTKALQRIQSLALERGGRCYVSPAHKRKLPNKGKASLVYLVKKPFERRQSYFPDEIMFEIELLRLPRNSEVSL